MNNVTPLFHREDRFANRVTAANSIYAPMIVDALPEDYGPNVNCGNSYEADPLEWFSARTMLATIAGVSLALGIIAVLPW